MRDLIWQQNDVIIFILFELFVRSLTHTRNSNNSNSLYIVPLYFHNYTLFSCCFVKTVLCSTEYVSTLALLKNTKKNFAHKYTTQYDCLLKMAERFIFQKHKNWTQSHHIKRKKEKHAATNRRQKDVAKIAWNQNDGTQSQISS